MFNNFIVRVLAFQSWNCYLISCIHW